MLEGFQRFDSWDQLLLWIAENRVVYYEAPGDLLPSRASVKKVGMDVKVSYGWAADFVAGPAYLGRFLKEDQAPSSNFEPELAETRVERPDSEVPTLRRVDPWMNNA